MSAAPALKGYRPPTAPPPSPGDYLTTERELYRVERVLDGRVLLEDCMTEALIDLPLDELAGLRPVKRAGSLD